MNTLQIEVALKVYREKNPKARATKHYRTRAGARRREYRCTFCDAYIDGESANYPQTKHAAEALQSHPDKCPAIPALLQEAAKNPITIDLTAQG